MQGLLGNRVAGPKGFSETQRSRSRAHIIAPLAPVPAVILESRRRRVRQVSQKAAEREKDPEGVWTLAVFDIPFRTLLSREVRRFVRVWT